MSAAEPDDWRAMGAEHISQIVRSLSEIYEYVIVDTPGAMNEIVATSLTEASIILLVTSLDVSSVKDTKTALRILQSWGTPPDRIRLILNDNTRATAVKPRDVEQACGVSAWQVIPHDQRVGVSVQTGSPMVLSQRKSKYTRAVMQMAAQLTGVGPDAKIQAVPVPATSSRTHGLLFGGRA
jgi:pilus assembly protein CpaE